MTKSGISAAVAVMMSLTAPIAFAQSMPQPARPTTPAIPAALTVQPDQMRASKLIGSSVYDVQNQNIGSVKDMIVDHTGRVAAIVVDVGSFLGMGGKYVAVSMNDLKTDNDRITLSRTKDQLKSAQAFHLDTNNQSNQAGH